MTPVPELTRAAAQLGRAAVHRRGRALELGVEALVVRGEAGATVRVGPP